MKKKILLIPLALLLAMSALVATACPAPAPVPEPEVIHWDISVWGGAGARLLPLDPWWREEMEKRTGGRFTTTIHYGAVLAPAKEKLDGIKAGLFEMAHFAVAFDPGKTPLASVFDLPGILPMDHKQIALMELALMEHPAIKEELQERWNAVYIGLSHAPLPPSFMGIRPIRSLADIEGERMRVHGKTGELLSRFGAIPTMFPAGKTFEALEKGMLDHVAMPSPSLYAFKIYEASKYYTYNVGLGSGSLWALVACKDAWDALPEDIKEIHRQLIQELMLERLPVEIATVLEGFRQEWKERGIEFIEFPAEERAKLSAASKPMWEEWVEEMEARGLPGREVLDYVLAMRKKIAGY